MEKSVCVIYGEGEVVILVSSVDMVSTERVFVNVDKGRYKDWVGLVKFSQVQRLVNCCFNL